MRHRFDVRVGPIAFRIGSAWRDPIDALARLYRDYPQSGGAAHFTVRLEPVRPWRRWIRPSVVIGGDHVLPEAAPLPLRLGLLAAEMGMNLQLALGERRFLLLHAATVERDDVALILTGESGAGKSTLATLLATRGWRFMGDEFALLEPETGLLWPFPRPSSLKNASIETVAALVPADRLGPELADTPKGRIRHILPTTEAIAAMTTPARPAAIVFPRYGAEAAVRPVSRSETFVRLTQASTNYVALGERGFAALTRLVATVPAIAIDYPDTASAVALIEDVRVAL